MPCVQKEVVTGRERDGFLECRVKKHNQPNVTASLIDSDVSASRVYFVGPPGLAAVELDEDGSVELEEENRLEPLETSL